TQVPAGNRAKGVRMESYQVQFRDLLKRAVSEPGTISAAYSAFHNYSIGNQLAALVQCSLRKIPVGPISTLKDWNSKGRFVKRGEKAIWLCMPITGKKTAKDEAGQETTEHYTFFVWKPRWFVLAQTEGEEYKPDAASHSWDRAQALEAAGCGRIFGGASPSPLVPLKIISGRLRVCSNH